MSSYIEACGIAPSAAVGSLGAGVGLWESAEVRVNPVGTVEVLTGSHSHKVEAKAKKIAAHMLEADEGDIVIENGEVKVAGTDKTLDDC